MAREPEVYDMMCMEGGGMKPEEIITRDPDILGGVPVFTGTRVPVDSLIAHLKSGANLDTYLADFPSVRREQAEALLELAKEAVLGNARAA